MNTKSTPYYVCRVNLIIEINFTSSKTKSLDIHLLMISNFIG